jgi:hypothetical protein
MTAGGLRSKASGKPSPTSLWTARALAMSLAMSASRVVRSPSVQIRTQALVPLFQLT